MNSHPPLAALSANAAAPSDDAAAPSGNAADATARPVRLDRSLEKLGLWRATDMMPRAATAGRIAGTRTPEGQPSPSQGQGQDAQAPAQPGQRRFGPQRLDAAEQARCDGPLVSGYPEVDQLFPDGHWPAADLVEVMCDLRGVGELRLLMPVLARLSRQQARWVAWIAPPHIPYAPALAACGVDIRRVLLIHPRTERERLWAMEQALKSGTCSAVLGWPGQPLRQQDIRRLQLAATQGNTMGLLFRPESAALEASPAPFRLVLRSAGTVDPAAAPLLPVTPLLRVKMLKRRGGWATDFVPVALALTPSPPAAATTAPATTPLDAQAFALVPSAEAPRHPATAQRASTLTAAGQASAGQAPASAPPAPAQATPAPEHSPVESLSGLQRHLAQWRASMQRTTPASTPPAERRESGERYGLFGSFDPGRLVIGRRRGNLAERPMTAKPGTVRTTACPPPVAHPPPRRQAPDGGVKPVF